MPAVKATTREFWEEIKREYLKLKGVKEDGIPVYTDEIILHRVGKKFYRSARTIENIVFDRA